MYKKSRRKFWYVVVFTVVVALISMPALPFLPENVQKYANKLAINLGLDLQGGLHLEYKLDLSKVPEGKEGDAKDAVQAVVERRVNAYGVGEPIVQLAQRAGETFLIVEFPGAESMEDVKNVIQKTPFLEFRVEKTQEEMEKEQKQLNEEMSEFLTQIHADAQKKAIETLNRIKNGEEFEVLAAENSRDADMQGIENVIDFSKKDVYPVEFSDVLFSENMHDGDVYQELVTTEDGWFILKKLASRGKGEDLEVKSQVIPFTKISIPVEPYKATELTGEFLEQANLEFSGGGMGGGVSDPQVGLQFDSKGKELFAQITKENLGKRVAIYLDNELKSAPTVQAEIVNGRAVISGDFTTKEAKDLAQSLNEGALPVPIELVSQQSVEATLGAEALQKGLKAGVFGLALVMLYMILYYRFFGVIASIALGIYAASLVTIFKLSNLTPMAITLTLAGIAGLILSIGMAVDANVLIFERIKEELRLGKGMKRAVDEGFNRAWPSIRDGNLSTIITSVILMSMGTGFVYGFALTLIIGVLVSMFTAIILVKIIMKYICGEWLEERLWLVMHNKKKL
ncbi:MAG: protein translocase subunit SecD [Candidatus Moraniibacteriota bacterium]|nr:MAG: protein translocase subunit SecD [Candidatus Moranbacteria bacterium]